MEGVLESNMILMGCCGALEAFSPGLEKHFFSVKFLADQPLWDTRRHYTHYSSKVFLASKSG